MKDNKVKHNFDQNKLLIAVEVRTSWTGDLCSAVQPKPRFTANGTSVASSWSSFDQKNSVEIVDGSTDAESTVNVVKSIVVWVDPPATVRVWVMSKALNIVSVSSRVRHNVNRIQYNIVLALILATQIIDGSDLVYHVVEDFLRRTSINRLLASLRHTYLSHPVLTD